MRGTRLGRQALNRRSRNQSYAEAMELPGIAVPSLARNPFGAAFAFLMKQRRAAQRTPREGDIYLFDTDGVIGRANIVDDSVCGLRLSGAESDCYERVRYILIMHTGVGHRVEHIWQHDGQAGFRIARLNMRGPALDKGMEDLRAIWRRRRA